MWIAAVLLSKVLVLRAQVRLGSIKGRRFSEKDWYYLQAQTDMPFHYLKLIEFPRLFATDVSGISLKISCETKTNVISKIQV